MQLFHGCFESTDKLHNNVGPHKSPSTEEARYLLGRLRGTAPLRHLAYDRSPSVPSTPLAP